MAWLHKSEYFRQIGRHHKFADHPLKIDIYNWRLMRYGEVKVREQTGNGTLICLTDSTFFVPNVGVDALMKLNLRNQDHVLDIYFESIMGYYPPIWCHVCNGAGKTDWIQKISPARKPHMAEAKKLFIRDTSKHYVYPDSVDHALAKTLLYDGEEYCPRCSGFGFLLDGRFRIFKGMKNIKNSLQEIQVK